jgi:hypothetical protein
MSRKRRIRRRECEGKKAFRSLDHLVRAHLNSRAKKVKSSCRLGQCKKGEQVLPLLAQVVCQGRPGPSWSTGAR